VFDIYVFDIAREPLGLLEHIDSIQWLENYQSAGEVKIVARPTGKNLVMLADGHRLFKTTGDTAARVCETETNRTKEGPRITARAQITSILLSDRVVMATENITDAEQGMYTAYENNRRGLPVEIAPVDGYGRAAVMERTWGDVLGLWETVAGASGLGFKVLFDPETGIETSKVYCGIDRSIHGSNDYIGYFGTDIGNVENPEIVSGSSNYKNVAVVAGGGDGADRYVRVVSLGPVTGENRRELFVDARDLQRTYQVATDTGTVDENGNPIIDYETKTYTNQEYDDLLDGRGFAKLAEHMQNLSIKCNILQNEIRYGVDYFLGDRMPVRLVEFGITVSAVVSSALHIQEKSGETIKITLSDFKIMEV